MAENLIIAEGGKAEKYALLHEQIRALVADEKDMRKYVCVTCGWIYDPEEGDTENGVPPGTPFNDLPDDWTCPACGVGKEHFEKI